MPWRRTDSISDWSRFRRTGSNLAIAPLVEEEFVFIFACGQDALPLELTPEVLQAPPLIAFEAGSGTRS